MFGKKSGSVPDKIFGFSISSSSSEAEAKTTPSVPYLEGVGGPADGAVSSLPPHTDGVLLPRQVGPQPPLVEGLDGPGDSFKPLETAVRWAAPTHSLPRPH